MKNINIYSKTPEDAIDFVSEVSKVPYEADLSYGNCWVDAKSILGVLGMAVCKKAKLTIYGEENIENTEQTLQRYVRIFQRDSTALCGNSGTRLQDCG